MFYSDLPNKPISFLLLNGANGDGSDSITTPTLGNFKFFANNNAFVQINNLTLNSEIYVDDGATIRFESVTINGHIETNNNSTVLLKNSNLTGTTDNPPLRIKANGHAEVDNTNITGSSNGYDVIWLWNNGSLMLQGNSVINAPSGINAITIQANSSVIVQDDVQINSIDRTGIGIERNSSVELNGNISIIIGDSSVGSVWIYPTGSLRINGDSININTVSCEGITSHVQNDGNTSVDIFPTCNGTGYSPIFFTYTDFPDANCGKMGLQDLNESQCSNFQPNQGTVCDGGQLPGCWYDSANGYWLYNNCGNSTSDLNTVITAVACKNFTFNN